VLRDLIKRLEELKERKDTLVGEFKRLNNSGHISEVRFGKDDDWDKIIEERAKVLAQKEKIKDEICKLDEEMEAVKGELKLKLMDAGIDVAEFETAKYIITVRVDGTNRYLKFEERGGV